MNVVKQNQMKLKITKLSQNVSNKKHLYYIYIEKFVFK